MHPVELQWTLPFSSSSVFPYITHRKATLTKCTFSWDIRIITGADFSSQASKGAVELPFKHVTGYFWYVYAVLFLTSGTVIIHKFVMILCLTYMKIMILK